MGFRTGFSTTCGVVFAIICIPLFLAGAFLAFGVFVVMPQLDPAIERVRQQNAVPAIPQRANDPVEAIPAADVYDADARFLYWSGLRQQHWEDAKLAEDPKRWANLDALQKRDLEERLKNWDGKLKAEFDKELREHPELEKRLEKAMAKPEKRA